MEITVIGTGYVGLVSGTCFADMGHNVTCVDKLSDKIAALNAGDVPIYEPGLEDLIPRLWAMGSLRFTTDTAAAVATADVVFIAVGTPPHPETGHADMTYVHAAATEIAQHMTGYTVIVNKSTVPVGTGDVVEALIEKTAPDKDFAIVSNPEFLREGAAINDFMHPDRIVIGSDDERALNQMRALYAPLTKAGYPLLETSRKSAELIKYASNAFLATKISFINEMADLCEAAGGNIYEVAKGMGLDSRIGDKFLQPGPGYGGSCFPKDTLALIKTGEDHQVPLQLVRTTVKVNDERKIAMADKIIHLLGGSVAGKQLAVLGLTFKANTDDMRDSPSLAIIPALIKAGATIRAYDPEGMTNARTHFGDTITYAASLAEAITGGDAIAILTEWAAFKDLKEHPAYDGVTPIVDLRFAITGQG